VKECPKCGNDHWKVYIGADTGLGNCFAGDCETKYNRWSFIAAYLGKSNAEVYEHIKAYAREQGWRAPRRAAVAVELEPLALPPSVALPIGNRNLEYLERRGIQGDLARYFQLRICVRGRFGGQDYSNRVIIPIFDLEGQLVSFQGRDITGEAERKYLFPAGYASTGAHLFNGQNVHHTRRVVVGEGVFDVMALKVAMDGEPELRDVVPVGTFGKHLSFGGGDDQAHKFQRLRSEGVEQVTMMWDAEPAALGAAIEAGMRLKGMGYTARIAVLPPGCDPNEVAADVVRRAFYRAEVVSPAIGARLRIALRTA
jgi:DNA primase